jgi:F420-dependent oxidoreductase-like protein
MKLAIGLNPTSDDWEGAVRYVQEAEKLGVDSVWAAEMWGYDAATPLAYLAAKTSRIKLGSGIMQAGSRTPTMVAMTAQTLYSLSGGRFKLGIGVSGPQVIQGWYGADFSRANQRLKEQVAIVRMITSGERLNFQGELYKLPLPGTEGKALRSVAKPTPDLPVYLATLGPKNLELTGEIADGWLGTSFIPEKAEIYLDHLATGAKKAGRSLADLDLQVAAGVVAFSEDVDALIAPRKPGLAFTLGAMGSREHNFYNQVYQRAGYADIALEVQDLWLKGQREKAAALVPDELVLKTNLLGTDDMVLERLRLYQKAGITTISVQPAGENLADQLATLERLLDLIKRLETV